MPKIEKQSKFVQIILWAVSILLMFFFAYYQRATGPTYPIKIRTTIDNKHINAKLIRSWDKPNSAQIKIPFISENIEGTLVYKRFKSYDNWDSVPMIKEETHLVGLLPQLPPAGKMMYHVLLFDKKEQKFYLLNEKPAILRYRGSVPSLIVVTHVIFMFLTIAFAMRTGLEAIFIQNQTYKLAFLTLLFLFIGGFIFGPLMQKYAFGVYWSGFPFGNDLTDNKTLITFVFWFIAFLVLRKKPKNRFWPVLAAIMSILTYLIPHSLFGSEIDFTVEEAN